MWVFFHFFFFFCGLNCSLLKSHTAMVHSINANKE